MSYCPLPAQALYKRRREACRPHKRLEYAPLHSYIQTCILEYHWPPAGFVPTIYRAIHTGLLNPSGTSEKFMLRKYGITGNGVTRKAAKNVEASSSYRIPSRIVLPVQQTVPSVGTGKPIP